MGFRRSLGTQLGPYKLVERLGVGDLGVVYLEDQETPLR
jgi:hypothetical protein